MKNLSAFIFLIPFVLLNCKTISNEDITIQFHYTQDIQHIGKKNGVMVFISKFNDTSNIFDLDDIEEKSQFSANTTKTADNNNIYPVTCRLWKKLGMMYLLCHIEILSDEEFIQINKKHTFNYKEYNVKIDFYALSLKLFRYDINMPYLLTEKEETINVKEKQEIINLEFKVDSYNNEPLYYMLNLYNTMKIDKCQLESKKLKCQILKKNFDIIAKKNTHINILYLAIPQHFGLFQFVYPFNIIYPDTSKKNIYINLVKLKQNIIESGNCVTYETDLKDFPKYKSDTFKISLWSETNACYFIKHENSEPLYMVCITEFNSGNYTIEEIKEYNLKDIHYKYNFIIKPKKLNEKLSILNKFKRSLKEIYPDTLDFTSKDSIDLYFNQDNYINVRINKDGSDIKCENLNDIKKCTVTKSHFKGKKGGYYYIYHEDGLGNYIPYYEHFGVKVILSGSDNNSYKIKNFSILYLLICLVIL